MGYRRVFFAVVPLCLIGQACSFSAESFRHRSSTALYSEGYQFGDITRGLLGRASKDVSKLTGKETYEFGDFTRWLDQEAKKKVAEFTDQPDYQFGDISKTLFKKFQQGEYSKDDVFLFLKIAGLLGMQFQPVAAFLPAKVLIDMAEVSVAQSVGEKITKALTTEVDQRMKQFVTGDRNYKLGDITKKAVAGDKDVDVGNLTKKAVSMFTGKDKYEFGDVTKQILQMKSGKKDSSTMNPILALAPEMRTAFEKWDKARLNSKDMGKLDLGKWDQVLMTALKEKK